MATVLAAGPLFLDVIQYGLAHAPHPGEEQWVPGGDIMAGGVANQAVACARLGLETNVVTNIGTDRAGRWVGELLAEEHIRLEGSTRGGSQSVTVAQVFGGDRAFTTYGDAAYPVPPADMPAPDFLIASLDYLPRIAATLRRWRAAGCIAVVDMAWDPIGRWDASDLDPLTGADIAVPNEPEALAYTRTNSVHDAAARLLERVPALVITRGADGILLAERAPQATSQSPQAEACTPVPQTSAHPTITELPAIEVRATDTTGAGDSFTAGLVRGLAAGATLTEAAVLGQVTAAWTVQRVGGSAAAPTAAELRGWAQSGELRWARTSDAPDPAAVTKILQARL